MSARIKIRYYYVMLVLSPILGVYLAIRNLDWRTRRGVLIMAITLFGATIFLAESADGYRLREDLYEHYVGLDISVWFHELLQILQFKNVEGVKGDVYSHFFSYLIGHFMGIPSQYFVFVSFVYGYFYINSMSSILQWDKRQSRSLLFWGLVFVFITYRFLDAIQSVRTYTGAWVLFYGVYNYHLTRKIKYLALMACAPLIHVAYFLIALPAFAIAVVKRVSPKILVPLYVLSFLVTVNSSSVVAQLETTELGASKVEGYYREDSDDYRTPEAAGISQSFYKEYGRGWALRNSPHFAAAALILFGLFSRRRMTKLEMGMLSTGLLMAIMANLGSFIPVFYNRAMVNGGMYILATLIMLLIRGELLNAKGNKLLFRKGVLWLVFMSFVPYLFYVASNMLQFTSIFMLVGMPVGLIQELNISIREMISVLNII